MIKPLLLPIGSFLALYLLGFWIHDNYLALAHINLPFSLEKSYLFHFLFSSLLIIHFEFLSRVKSVNPLLGIIYLVSVVLKIVLFAIVFKSVVIDQETLKLNTKYALLLPALIFLLFEVVFVSKILLRKEPEH